VTTVLQYLVIAAVIGLVVFGLAVFVFGRGEQLAPLSPRTSPTELPDNKITADDVRTVRFAMALRGYRMSDVDWALERMAEELDRLRAQVAALSGEGSESDDAAHPAEHQRDGPDPGSSTDRAGPGAEPREAGLGDGDRREPGGIGDAVLAGMAHEASVSHPRPAGHDITGAPS
jgi:DivIVA domain-containing protein